MPAHRFLVKFTTQESAKIARSLKTLGFTFSELLDAACVVATFEHNPVPVDKAEITYIKGPSPCVTYPSSPPPPSFVISLSPPMEVKANLPIVPPCSITLTDRLPAPIDRRKHVVSALVFAPFRFSYAPLAPLPRTGRARLLAAMRLAKQHYDGWLANPCLPHLFAALAPHIAPTVTVTVAENQPRGKYAPVMSNVGRADDYVTPVWPKGAGEGERGERAPVIRVEDMHMACRIGRVWFRP